MRQVHGSANVKVTKQRFDKTRICYFQPNLRSFSHQKRGVLEHLSIARSEDVQEEDS
jgi:hypothetical protein